MWLMTKHGFYSIVQKKPDEYHVRVRERQDLRNLVDRVPLQGAVIIDTPDADYCYRIVTDKATVLAILAYLGESLDYSNFKGKIDATPDQKHKPYHKIWRLLADSLGAYGRKTAYLVDSVRSLCIVCLDEPVRCCVPDHFQSPAIA